MSTGANGGISLTCISAILSQSVYCFVDADGIKGWNVNVREPHFCSSCYLEIGFEVLVPEFKFFTIFFRAILNLLINVSNPKRQSVNSQPDFYSFLPPIHADDRIVMSIEEVALKMKLIVDERNVRQLEQSVVK